MIRLHRKQKVFRKLRTNFLRLFQVHCFKCSETSLLFQIVYADDEDFTSVAKRVNSPVESHYKTVCIEGL